MSVLPPRRSALLLALAGLTACQAPAGPGGVAPGKKPAARATASPLPSTRPTASAAAAAPAQPLRQPAGARTLAGVVRLDAGYIMAAGAGRLVAGGAILSNNGGTVLANNAGNLIANNGGALSGALLAAGPRSYRLAEAAAAPALGTLAPAAGVEVGVWSIDKRAFLPIGEDAAGQPVYSAYTDLAGKYALFLPPDDAGTGIVVAAVDRTSADPRLTYGVLTPIATSADVAIDEDTALLTGLLREFLASRLYAAIRDPDTERVLRAIAGDDATLTDAALMALMVPFFDAFGRAGRELGLDKDPAKARAATLRATDYAYKHFDPAAIEPQPRPFWYHVKADEKPFDVLLDVMRTLRVQGAAKLAADPGFLATTSFMPKIDARRAAAGLPPFVVRRPSDFGQVLIEEYLTVLDAPRLEALVGPQDGGFEDLPLYKAMRTLMREVGALSLPQALGDRARDDAERTWVTGPLPGLGNDNLDRLNVSMKDVLVAIMTQLLAQPEAEQAEMRARLAEP